MDHSEQQAVTPLTAPDYQHCSFAEAALPLQGASLAVLPAGLVLFGFLALHLGPRFPIPEASRIVPGTTYWELWPLLGLAALVLMLPLTALHEYAHGLAFQWAGATPSYRVVALNNQLLAFTAGCVGFRTPCRKYRVILAAPTVVVNAVGLLVMWPASPLRYLMAIALTFHLAGCVGDWWMLYVLRRVPSDDLIEDAPHGFRYPAPQ